MITAPNAAHSYANSSNKPASNLPTARKTGHTNGNAPRPPTPTYHPDQFSSCLPSLNDNDGTPNTPPPNSPQADHHPVTTVRQPAIKPHERREDSYEQRDPAAGARLPGGQAWARMFGFRGR
jgi:hypothetical protein